MIQRIWSSSRVDRTESTEKGWLSGAHLELVHGHALAEQRHGGLGAERELTELATHLRRRDPGLGRRGHAGLGRGQLELDAVVRDDKLFGHGRSSPI
jgi:hypothetical protein